MIWRDIFQNRKERIIIDIRNFNEIIENDEYSLFLQSNIIVLIIDYIYIIIVDEII